ncbi:hypothetical protein ATPR_2929 [Acetobacter tropicalis NBRC 101654]|uniref:Uncharacterized protein n=1 Tax=Acetobacter tropicalis NBRC 101654 TaxID=749388 RepID=F7VHT0_9PROT|nr:hypothetical protein ATPR_2929 [Acetobacter tropicalis NBRC 101654]
MTGHHDIGAYKAHMPAFFAVNLRCVQQAGTADFKNTGVLCVIWPVCV